MKSAYFLVIAFCASVCLSGQSPRKEVNEVTTIQKPVKKVEETEKRESAAKRSMREESKEIRKSAAKRAIEAEEKRYAL